MEDQMFKPVITAIALTIATITSAFASDWKVSEGYDKVTNTSSPYIVTYATKRDSQYGHTKPLMGIDCTSIYFNDLDILKNGKFKFRTNGMTKARTANGDIYDGSDGLTLEFARSRAKDRERFWKDNYEKQFANMIADKEMYVSFNSYARSDQSITVSLSGSSKALKWLSVNCILVALLAKYN
jgi:hypothetical protein